MSTEQQIEQFLAGGPHAVVGASRDRTKIGNLVVQAYQQNERPVFAVNPRATEVEGLICYPDLQSLPDSVHGVSVITPPAVTETVVEQAIAAGIKHIWLQPGAESDAAIEQATAANMNVIAGGPCILVTLGYRSQH